MDREELIALIKSSPREQFDHIAIHLFQYQYKYNSIYREWVDNLKVLPSEVREISDIPFLPISAFKHHKVHCKKVEEQVIFTSSGTTGSTISKHYVFDLNFYLDNASQIFKEFYGPVEDYCILALLPSYLERNGSSLVAMVDYFIRRSKYAESGFFLYNHSELFSRLEQCKRENIPTILFGVSFALLDFIENRELSFPELMVMETGGMKGRKKEMTREDLHDKLSRGFGVEHVHSEYGMTELFSQAYSKELGVFVPGGTMKVIIKDISDPLSEQAHSKSGVINIIDLANIDSCAFIETQDLGVRYADGSFEILGRLDVSDIRGCNLMVADV